MDYFLLFLIQAGGMTQLSEFYEACAQVEIDDYRDYDKVCLRCQHAFKWKLTTIETMIKYV